MGDSRKEVREAERTLTTIGDVQKRIDTTVVKTGRLFERLSAFRDAMMGPTGEPPSVAKEGRPPIGLLEKMAIELGFIEECLEGCSAELGRIEELFVIAPTVAVTPMPSGGMRRK
jgi:hypothetical protein